MSIVPKLVRVRLSVPVLWMLAFACPGVMRAQRVRSPVTKDLQDEMNRRNRRGIDARDSATVAGMRNPAFTSTHDIARSTLQRTDELRFFIDRSRPLSLRTPQIDSLRALHDAMQEEQKPLFRLLSKVDDHEKRGPKVGVLAPGSGGGRGGGSRGLPPQEVDSVLFPDKPRVGLGPSDSARALVGRLSDVQEAFTDRGRALLTTDQLRRADSLWAIKLAKDRDRR